MQEGGRSGSAMPALADLLWDSCATAGGWAAFEPAALWRSPLPASCFPATQCPLASPPALLHQTQPTEPPAMTRPTCLLLALALTLLTCSTSGARLLKGEVQATARASATGQGAAWASGSASSTGSGALAGAWQWEREGQGGARAVERRIECAAAAHRLAAAEIQTPAPSLPPWQPPSLPPRPHR